MAEHLSVHVRAHAGVESAVVERPLVGVALQLPDGASPAEVARAIDAEQVTAGFLDFAGRCCVAVPAQVEDLEQTAHAVAKVLHGLLEIHTPYINRFADACPEPPLLPVLDDAAILETVCAVLDAASMLTQHLHALRGQALPPDIAQVLDEGLDLAGAEVAAARRQMDVQAHPIIPG
jgi:hypothetical protein